MILGVWGRFFEIFRNFWACCLEYVPPVLTPEIPPAISSMLVEPMRLKKLEFAKSKSVGLESLSLHVRIHKHQERQERQEPRTLPQRPRTKGWGGGGPPLGVFNISCAGGRGPNCNNRSAGAYSRAGLIISGAGGWPRAEVTQRRRRRGEDAEEKEEAGQH